MDRDIFNKYLDEREKMNKLHDAPKYRRLKYLALFFVAIATVLLLYIAFRIDRISPTALLIMRGSAGLCAIVFAILVGLLSYSANKEHVTNRWKNKKHSN